MMMYPVYRYAEQKQMSVYLQHITSNLYLLIGSLYLHNGPF